MPDTFLGLALFVLFVSPGYAWVRVEELWRPREERSGLTEAAELVTAGAMFSLIGLGVTILVGESQSWILDAREIVNAESAKKLVVSQPATVAWSMLLLVGAAHVSALLAARVWFGGPGSWFRNKFGRRSRLRVGHTVWFDIFGSVDKKTERVSVSMGLDGGMVIDGFLKAYSADAAVEDQVLALQGPITVTLRDGERVATPAEFAMVLGSNAKWILGRVEQRPPDIRGSDGVK